MRLPSSKEALWLLAALIGSAWSQPPATTDGPTIDHPYTQPAKPNGLPIEKPNFILFMPDQLRYDSLGVFGNELVNTPNIDAFAKEATRFTNTYTQASVCSQSRCSMFTGQYPHVNGHRTLENLLKPWEPNLFKSMKENGYHVAYLSPRGDFYAENATELSVNEYGFLTSQTLPGFSSPPYQEDKNDILNRVFYKGVRNATQALDYDETMVRGALKWLERPPQDKPWVLFLPLLFPHCPFTVEEPYFSMYDRQEMPLPIGRDEMTGYQPRFIDTIHQAYGLGRATPELWREVKATYYGMISRLDEQFGRIVNATKAQGLWDSTITMFFTDHGEFLGDYGLIEKWPSGLNEQLTHEPLIVGGAGLPQGKVYGEMAEMVDLVPTMLHFATIGENYMHFGKSLVDAIHAAGRDEILPHKSYAYTEGGFLLNEEPLLEQGPFPYDIKAALQHNDTALVGKSVSIRDKEWTYVYRLYEPDELYFRKNDTYELYNVAASPDYQHVRAKMRETVLKWMMETSDVIPWYKDQRAPEVELPSPYEQYLGRGDGEL